MSESSTFIAKMNERCGISETAQVVAGNGGLAKVRITHPLAEGEIYLHGAHVMAWKPAGGVEVLWVSEKSNWVAGKAIRGGVPICFPWFGPNPTDPKVPAHGFARTKIWELEGITQSAEGVEVVMVLRDDAASRKLWGHGFVMRHRVLFGKNLVMSLEVTNTGNAAVEWEEAQHTYLTVSDVREVQILGLEGTEFIDKVDKLQIKKEPGKLEIRGETDRVYLNTMSPVVVADPQKQRSLGVHKENSRATVVWNPWIEKAMAMADFGDEEWPGMVCVETCNVGDFRVRIEPGQTHIMTTKLAVSPL